MILFYSAKFFSIPIQLSINPRNARLINIKLSGNRSRRRYSWLARLGLAEQSCAMCAVCCDKYIGESSCNIVDTRPLLVLREHRKMKDRVPPYSRFAVRNPFEVAFAAKVIGIMRELERDR